MAVREMGVDSENRETCEPADSQAGEWFLVVSVLILVLWPTGVMLVSYLSCRCCLQKSNSSQNRATNI